MDFEGLGRCLAGLGGHLERNLDLFEASFASLGLLSELLGNMLAPKWKYDRQDDLTGAPKREVPGGLRLIDPFLGPTHLQGNRLPLSPNLQTFRPRSYIKLITSQLYL